jgi:hypothetical protein
MKDNKTKPQPSETGKTLESEAIPTHPEEMKTAFNLRIGDRISLQGTARVTPAGIVTVGITVCAILLASGFLKRAARNQS